MQRAESRPCVARSWQPRGLPYFAGGALRLRLGLCRVYSTPPSSAGTPLDGATLAEFTRAPVRLRRTPHLRRGGTLPKAVNASRPQLYGRSTFLALRGDSCVPRNRPFGLVGPPGRRQPTNASRGGSGAAGRARGACKIDASHSLFGLDGLRGSRPAWGPIPTLGRFGILSICFYAAAFARCASVAPLQDQLLAVPGGAAFGRSTEAGAVPAPGTSFQPFPKQSAGPAFGCSWWSGFWPFHRSGSGARSRNELSAVPKANAINWWRRRWWWVSV